MKLGDFIIWNVNLEYLFWYLFVYVEFEGKKNFDLEKTIGGTQKIEFINNNHYITVAGNS